MSTGEDNGMQVPETLTRSAWRGYQRDTFPASSWVYEDGMLREELVLAYDLHSVTFTTAVARSKFKDLPGFARAARGHIALQHHGDVVWFRHLQVRLLPDAWSCEKRT
jgi:hypothetical protein